MGRYILSVPEEFYQEALTCWAAGGASFLRATKLGIATPQQLIARFEAYTNSDGSLPEGDSDLEGSEKGGFVAVFAKLGVRLELIPAANFNYIFVSQKLKTKGHLLLLAGVGGDMGHTYVIYGVGVPNDSYFSAFDSLKDSGGYRNRTFADFNESSGNIYVGWAAWAGP